MRSIISFLVLITTVLTAMAQEQTSVLAEVKEVTVFTNGAEVSSKARLSLPKGTVKLIVQNVARNLDVKSVQLSGPTGMTVLSIAQESDAEIMTTNSKAKQLKDSLDMALAKREMLTNKQNAVQGALNILNNDKLLGGGGASVALADISKLVDYYQIKSLELKTELSKLDKELTTQDKSIAKLKERLRGYTGDGGQLAIQLVNASPIQGDLFISYMSYAANWQAYYDLKVADINKPMQLLYKAKVSQNTGVDWKNVKLSLSTGNPTRSGNAPVLKPSYANYYMPEAVLASRNTIQRRVQSFGATAAVAEVASDAGSPFMLAGPQTTVTENQLSVTFAVDMPYDIVSNGQEHSVSLKEHELAASFKYHAVPKLDKDAFFMAEITEFAQLNLIPGEANIIFENTYAGQSFIDPNVTTDTLNLSMGRDKAIVVNRERILDKKSTQVGSSTKRQVYTYEIKVRNTKSTAVELLLKDQYPISTDKSIEVELSDAGGAIVNKETGLLSWDLKLKPGETQTYRFTFMVKHLKDKNVVFN